jgi:cerevisin
MEGFISLSRLVCYAFYFSEAAVHRCILAGNDNRDACNYSPAGAEKAVTVAASTLGDERAYFSNHGVCVDVFAPGTHRHPFIPMKFKLIIPSIPGLNILSTWTGTPTAINTISGTSMASPHTAGLLAYLLSLYPHEQFDPVIVDDLLPGSLESQVTFVSGSLDSIYALTHASLPSWISNFLPSPRLVEILVPVPKRPATLTPVQLKKALVDLASKDSLIDLPEHTVNLLIFNNATSRK